MINGRGSLYTSAVTTHFRLSLFSTIAAIPETDISCYCVSAIAADIKRLYLWRKAFGIGQCLEKCQISNTSPCVNFSTPKSIRNGTDLVNSNHILL